MKTISIFINSLKLFLVNIKIYIFVFLLAPLIFAFMYGTIYKNILNPNRTIEKFKVAYVDLDGKGEAKPLEKIFEEGKLNKIVSLQRLSSTNNLNNDLLQGNYTAAIVVPKNFSQNIETNKKVSIEVLKAPSADTNGELVSDIVNNYCSYLNMNRSVYSTILSDSNNKDLTQKIFSRILPVIEADLNKTHLKYTSLPKAKLLDSNQQFAANMLIMSSLFIALAQAISILIEKKRGTLSRIYSTATNKQCFYFGKLIATFVISVVQIICFIVVSTLVIKVDFGNYLTMIPIILIHGLVITAITATIISLFDNISLVSVLFSLVVFMMSVLSGSFYPSDYYGDFIRKASHFTVNYWIKTLYFSNMFKDTFSSMAGMLTIILVISLFTISFGAVKLKYEY